ncbi:MAG: alpha/beta hydrolase [Pseudomonadota bacterium]
MGQASHKRGCSRGNATAEAKHADNFGSTPPVLTPVRSNCRKKPRHLHQHDAPPIVVMLPGFTGSHLAVDGERVWLHPRMFTRGFETLSVSSDLRQVEADGWISRYYLPFAHTLSIHNELHCFPYDWRLSIAWNAERFINALGDLLENPRSFGRPLRLIGHSMGGLILLYTALTRPQLWRRLCLHHEARMLIAASPTAGTYSSVRMLTGTEPQVGYLAAIDRRTSQHEWINVIRRFPGGLETLPRWGGWDFFDRGTWQDIRRHCSATWTIPEQQDLTEARHVSDVLHRGTPQHLDRIGYMIGVTGKTPHGLELSAGGKLEYRMTSRGDTLATVHEGMPRWSHPVLLDGVSHGSVFRARQHFETMHQLLETNVLDRDEPPQTPPMPARLRAGVALFASRLVPAPAR